ncbi:hypothetical protein H2198_008052 [Neophaeococcomyces mojaviensis]|uniref:Uncharacterized protein n=1 Tax=Neophaeococcomyces mojaviensis TaxID=3383035 RepID=A0ACC2ZYP4_9EURO|nr:hypothetical protein H2198_008052 [Knufia sp. JES_112]
MLSFNQPGVPRFPFNLDFRWSISIPKRFITISQDFLSQHHVPSLSIAIVQDQETTSTGFDYAQQAPSSKQSSCSKSLTAAAVILLIDDVGFPQLQYDASIHDLLPDDFVMSVDDHTRTVTLEYVLSHKTSMPSYVHFVYWSERQWTYEL